MNQSAIVVLVLELRLFHKLLFKKSLDIPKGTNKELAFQALQTDVMYRKADLIFSLVTQKLHASALNQIILIKVT